MLSGRSNSILRLLAGLALGVTASAQVPDGYVLVNHSDIVNSVNSGALTMIEPATGVTTSLVLQNGGKIVPLAKGWVVNPNDPTQLFCNPGLSVIGSIPIQQSTLQGSLITAQTTYYVTPGVTGTVRFWVAGSDVWYTKATAVTSGGGIYKVPIAGTIATLALPMANAHALTQIGTKLYVADWSTGLPSQIVEIDVLTLQPRTVGTGYASIRALATWNGNLVAGTENGDLVTVNPTTGAASLLLATNQGAIVAMAADGSVGFPIFATTNRQVFRYPIVTTPLFTSTGNIFEISAGRKPVAAALSYGKSCTGTIIQPAYFAFGGYPTIPSPGFQLALASLKPSTPGALMLGTSRTRLGALPLPLDLTVINMAGCWLYQDMLVATAFTSDAAGVATVPLPIPNAPGFTGAHVMAQGFSVDPVNNPFGLTTAGYELILR